MLGCGKTGLNMHFGGRTGKSLEKSIDIWYDPPYHGESLGPGIIQFHFNKFVEPSGLSTGLATNPNGWLLLQSFLYFFKRFITN